MCVLIKLCILLLFPLIIFILGKGLQVERLLFAGYVFILCLGSYCFTQDSSLWIKAGLFWAISALITLNLLHISLLKKIHYRLALILSFFTFVSGFPLSILFPFQTQINFKAQQAFLSFGWDITSSILLLVLISVFLIGLEEVWRNYPFSLLEKVFSLGTCFCWMAFVYLLYHLGITASQVSILVPRLLISLILIWTMFGYTLLKGNTFLKLNFHPSPLVVIRFTFTIAFLLGLSCIIWLDILARSYWPVNIPYLEIFVFLLFFFLVFALVFPSKYLNKLKEAIYYHFYLPTQDYALEIKFFLDVITRKDWREQIVAHLHEKLPTQAVGLYTSKENQFILEAKFPSNTNIPACLKRAEQKEGIYIPLKTEKNLLGYLYLLPIKKFSIEEKRLLQFWASTLGFLLHYFQEREKEEERQKLTIFSQAAAFILHDAKNLAQLLQLLSKNYHQAKKQGEIQEFIEELLPPTLEQAKIRAGRIIKRLEVFHPIKLNLKKIDLIPFIKDAITKFQRLAPTVKITFFSPLKEAYLNIDPDILRQILENLFFNAWQAGGDKVEINVELTAKDNGYLLSVQDNGPGIKPEYRSKLFKPFFTTKPKGTGLGLYQAKVLLERMEHKIWYEPNPVKGSIFYVWFKK